MEVRRTTIAIKPQTRERLRRLGRKGESYDEIIDRLLRIGEHELRAIEEAYRRIDETPRTEYVNIGKL